MELPSWTWVLFVAVALVIWAVVYLERAVQPLRCALAPPDTLSGAIVRACPIVTKEKYFWPTPYIYGRIPHTVWGLFGRWAPSVPWRREILMMADGGTVSLDWWDPPGGAGSTITPPETPIVLVVHGLTGGSEENYVRCFADLVRRATGWRICVWNRRGVGGQPLTSPRVQFMDDDDLAVVDAQLAGDHPAAPLYAVGFSAGANIVTKYLGRAKAATSIRAAVAIANPWDIERGTREFANNPETSRRIFDFALTWRLQQEFKRNLPVLKQLDLPVGKILRSSSMAEVHDRLHRRIRKAPSLEAFYRDSSSIYAFRGVAVPLLCIQAEDDPVAERSLVPWEEIRDNDHISIVMSATGGHLGFCEGWLPVGANWGDRLALEFLRASHDRIGK